MNLLEQMATAEQPTTADLIADVREADFLGLLASVPFDERADVLIELTEAARRAMH